MFRTYLASLIRPTGLIMLAVLILLSLLLWFLGPSVTVFGVTPLQSVLARIYTIIGIFVFYFLITFIRHVLVRRANAKLVNSMLANNELVSMGNDMASDEVELIRERLEKTLKLLRDNPVDRRKGGNYLFELPWYILIGPPGTGKSTILRNAGLDYPLAVEGQVAVQGVGGTRHCDWWISNEAVMIDTAGRYTSQDVNQGIDAAAWGGFLDLLKQHRKRRPVNGVMLAVSIADVAMSGEEERARQAEILRQRLRELHRAFEMRLPVYLFFTKCDLIAGFEEFFDDTDDREREQVWGITFDYDSQQMTYGPAFETGFIDLVGRLERRLPIKLGEERANNRRCRIYGFPHEFGSLATILRGFISDVFRVNRYEAQPLLRGVYFTSGTQEGTPFDRILGAMSRSFAVSPAQQMPMSGQGKAYFIKKLLTDIIFAEQNLVGRNPRVERRIATLYTAGYAAVIGLALGLSAYWLYGFNSSVATIREAEDTADRLRARLTEANRDRSLVNILPALDAARDLQNTVAVSHGWLGAGFLSVDARPELEPAASNVYDTILKSYLLPTLVSRLGAKVQLLSSSPEQNNLLLRDQLETYLMVTTGENYNEGRVVKEFEGQAQSAFALDPQQKSQMDAHIKSLVTLLPTSSTEDDPTVQAARNRLSQVPQVSDIYGRMVQDADRLYQLPKISIVQLLGTGVLRSDSATLGGSNLIPGLYTKNGFYEFFLKRLPEYIKKSTGSDWVLGKDSISNETYNQTAQQIVQAYTKDYIKAWRGAIDQVRVIDFETIQRGQFVLQELSGPQSPLTNLLNKLSENVTLPLPGNKTAAAAAGQAAAAAPGGAGVAGALNAVAGSAEQAAISTALGDAPWPGDAIGDAFRPLTALVDPQSTNSLAKVQQLFGDLYGTISSVATAPQPSAAAFDIVVKRAKNPTSDSFAQLRSEAATKPEPVRSMVGYVSDRNWELLMKLNHEYVDNKWQQEVVPLCVSILQDRYPFAPKASEEVSLQDFSDLFKPAGIIDKFYTDNLAPFVKVQGRQLTQVSIQNVTVGFNQNSLTQFSRARTIRDAFFGPQGTAPQAKFTIEPTFLGPKTLSSTFKLDDEQLIYRHGPIRAKDFTWPSKLDASVATLEVTLLDGTTQTVSKSGTWAIFRMLSDSGLSKARGQDNFVFSVGKGDTRASYRLKASSVVNPFNLGITSAFRCPPAL